MASATPVGGASGEGSNIGGDLPSLGSAATGGIDNGGGYSSDADDFLESALSMEHRVRMAQIWVGNPRNSQDLTHGFGDVI